jgi:phage terminase large subunit GpA-like protein
MSGTGSDAKRSSFTARHAFMTEVDKYDKAGKASRETAPVEQMEARTLAFGADARVWLECTASIETGRIWIEYLKGTQSRIVVQCPHCGHWWTPEREHLKGWDAGQNAKQARRLAYWECPACEGRHGEKERRAMNKAARLLHSGQEIDADGNITGDAYETDTFSFRWNAYNNLFWSTADIAAKHFTVAAGTDEDETEKDLLQFWWALPFTPREMDLAPIDPEQIKNRVSQYPQRQVPPNATALSVGVDVGKYLMHYVVIAWMADGTGYVIDYDLIEADADRLGTQRAAEVALLELRDLMGAGYPVAGSGDVMIPSQIWIDSGWKDTQHEIYAFCRRPECRGRYWPAKGYSYLQQTDRAYRQPTKKTTDVRMIGREYHAAKQKEHGVQLIHVNGDFWKTDVRDRFGRPREEPGALILFVATSNAHTKYAKHIEAERPKEIDHPDRGRIVVWEVVSRRNHFLDATYLADAAGHRAMELVAHPPATKPTNWWAGKGGRR